MNPKLPKKNQKSTLHLPNDLTSIELNQLHEYISGQKNYQLVEQRRNNVRKFYLLMSFKWSQNNVARIVINFYRRSNGHRLQKSIFMSNNLVFTDYNSRSTSGRQDIEATQL